MGWVNNKYTKHFILCWLEQYANFEGRARREEYWMFMLVWISVSWLLYYIADAGADLELNVLSTIVKGLWWIFVLMTLCPYCAVGVRRLHDIGMSGLWVLIPFVPHAGFAFFHFPWLHSLAKVADLFIYILCVQDSQPGTNKWGPNPKIEFTLP